MREEATAEGGAESGTEGGAEGGAESGTEGGAEGGSGVSRRARTHVASDGSIADGKGARSKEFVRALFAGEAAAPLLVQRLPRARDVSEPTAAPLPGSCA